MKRLSGFSLMEMMIVLAIVAIVAAASAPMINKRMVQESGVDQTWSKDGTSIVFNFDPSNNSYNKTTVDIGGKIPKEGNNAKLYINTDTDKDGNDSTPHISFGSNGGNIFNLTAGGNYENIILANDITLAKKSANESLDNSTRSGVFLGKKITSARSDDTIPISGNNNDKRPHYEIAIGDNATAKGMNAIAIGRDTISDRGIAIGGHFLAEGEERTQAAYRSVAIGSGAQANNDESVVIGYNTKGAKNSVSIGSNVLASGKNAIAIGTRTAEGQKDTTLGATAGNSIAIGVDTKANFGNTIAIGNSAKALHFNSVAIGYNAKTIASNQIVLGDSTTTVYIPGNLVVDGNTLLGGTKRSITYVREATPNSSGEYRLTYFSDTCSNYGGSGYTGWNVKRDLNSISIGDMKYSDTSDNRGNRGNRSDRRLKNVGEEFKGGLAEVKKLEVFNYTYKDDKEKTPHVGVMAQDLKKIFPKAVTKGEDGFLRIRMEDMFYALVNAVKELDAILTGHDKRIKELEKQNQEQKEIIAKLEKRLEALEKAK